MKTSLLVCVSALLLQSASGQIIFYDDFESGNLNNWTTTSPTAPSPLTIDSTRNVDPSEGTRSAFMDTSADRMHNNLGSEIAGHATFTSYIYDASGTASRVFNEVRGYNGGTGLPDGGTTASGTLGQLLAIGKYNTTTLTGDTWDGTKYQARVVSGTGEIGWFNLNNVGSPNRSTGWHRFDIERLADGTTLNFYVDNILSRTIINAAAADWDTLVLGPGLGTTVGDAWIDGMSVNVGAPIPEPASGALAVLGAGLLLRLRRRQ